MATYRVPVQNDEGWASCQAVMTDGDKLLVTADYLNQSVKTDASPEFVDIKATQHIYFDAVQTATGDGTTTIDWGLGNKFYFTFGAQADTFTFTAPDGPCNLVLVLKQDGTGSREATWPESVMWPSGTAPTLSTGANDVDIVCFFYDGTNYFGNISLDFSVPA